MQEQESRGRVRRADRICHQPHPGSGDDQPLNVYHERLINKDPSLFNKGDHCLRAVAFGLIMPRWSRPF
jgi:hypothetical protein